MYRALVFAGLALLSSAALAQAPSSAAEAAAPSPAEAAAPSEALAAVSTEPAPPASDSGESGGVKLMSGMSILGNEEAPKSLVIVPWKSSQLGDEVGIRNDLDDRALPVDREVFMREVHYFDLRSGRSQ